MELTTPALLFSAISLLLLAYTNRFLALANLVRSIKPLYLQSKEQRLLAQIENLKKRIFLIRNMQGFGILSFFCCVLCMFLLYYDLNIIAEYVFGVSLLLLMVSLFLSFREIQISANALRIDLADLEDVTENKENSL